MASELPSGLRVDTPNCVLLLRSGDEVIHDRIAFAGTNYKPLMMLRDAWASEASVWLSSYGQLKRAYDREVEAVQAAEARAAALGRRGEGALYHYTASFTGNYTEKSIFSIHSVKHTV